MKRQPIEKILANHMSDKGLLPKIYKNLNNSIAHKTKESNWNMAGYLNRMFSKEDPQMANRYIKRCSSSGTYKSKPQWAITSHLSEYYYWKIRNGKYWQGCEENITFVHYKWKYKLV